MPAVSKTSPLTGKLTFTSIKPPDLSTCSKSDLKAYFENSYDLNESLFTSLKDDSVFYCYPDYLRLPLIFYYGHTAVVYINKLILADFIKPSERIDFEIEKILETGVDEMSWDDTENFRMGGKFKWPSVAEVVAYRAQVRKLVLKRIDEIPLELPINKRSVWWALLMCMEHERVHLETSSVLIRQLPVTMVTKPAEWSYAPHDTGKAVASNPMIKMESSEVTLGKPHDFPSYGWDNEYGEWNIKVPAFEASSFMVTNKEFLDFVKDNGYARKGLWSDEGWKWVQFKQAKHPVFWVCHEGCKSGCGGDLSTYSHCGGYTHLDKFLEHLNNGQNSYCNGHSQVDENGHQGKDEGGGSKVKEFRFRCMFDVVDMPWNWPVEVNYHEAKAFCAWKGPGYRLPAEAEHHILRGPQDPVSNGTSCDIIYKTNTNANLNMAYGSSTPVNMYPANKAGFYDVFGNVWEWLEDHFNGLPGTDTDPFYDDFSTPCYDGYHTIIMGGSWVSTGDEASRFARFAFRRHFFQHLGFRLARSVPNAPEDPVDLPIRIVSSHVYIQGHGDLETCTPLDTKKANLIKVPTTNKQILQESDTLNVQLFKDYNDVNAQSIADYINKTVNKLGLSSGRALHIGCGTGALSFLMSKAMPKILATDYCGKYVDTSIKIFSGECIAYKHPDEEDQVDANMTHSNGDHTNGVHHTTTNDDTGNTTYEAKIPDGSNIDNIVFKQLTWLPNEVEYFDVVLITSIDRLLTPEAWLLRMREVVKENGVLMITTTQQWDAKRLRSAIGYAFDMKEEAVISKTSMTMWTHKV